MVQDEFSANASPLGAQSGEGRGSDVAPDSWDKLVSDASGFVPDAWAGSHLSIRNKILLSHLIIVVLVVGVNAMLLVRVEQYNRQFDHIITNILTANSINGYVKPAIDLEMWNIVAGKTAFAEGSQYQIIDGVNDKVGQMIEGTDSDKSRIKLEVILRAMDSLTRYVDLMGEQIARGSTVAENEKVLENVRGVSDVVEASIQDYMLFEVNRAEQSYMQAQERFNRWAVIYMALTTVVVVFSVGAAWLISRSIYVPITKLHNVTTTITQHDLQSLINRDNADEITELGISFNIMIGRIRELLNAVVEEQENLKKSELRALQAQINPHFLYNTLDTIIWMAESRRTEDVVEIVSALSTFFRVTLSKGKDWITLREEIQRTESYLTIQKIRYRDILDYVVDVDPEILDCTVLKLTLQPLVENALYHGIKNRRGGGTITVRARRADGNCALLEVIDNGAGFTSDKLLRVQRELEDEDGEFLFRASGFGLGNVSKRIKLYYGREFGLTIDSDLGSGTRVALRIPLQDAPNERISPNIENNSTPESHPEVVSRITKPFSGVYTLNGNGTSIQ
jgi:two-component system sensor histidine kinase YesM